MKPRITIYTKELPQIPKEYLIVTMFLTLAIMRMFGIDTFVTAGMSTLIGYQTGKHIEQK